MGWIFYREQYYSDITDTAVLKNNNKCFNSKNNVLSPRHDNNWSYLILVGCWVLWHINLCMLFNAKSIYMYIISSI